MFDNFNIKRAHTGAMSPQLLIADWPAILYLEIALYLKKISNSIIQRQTLEFCK